MVAFISLISFFGVLIGGFFSLKAGFKKQPKKQALLLTGISFVVMIGAGLALPTSPRISIAEKEVETNDRGIALIEGTTNDQSNITLDGKKIKTNNGEFSYEVTLKDDNPQKLTFVASIGDKDKVETIEVKPSKAFIAFLNKEKQEQKTLKEAETALVLAENKPTQKNYDEAATRITSLTKEQDDFTKRLAIVKENVPIHEAVELAETKQTKEQVDSATALVAKATLNKSSLLKRLETVHQKITEKEKVEKQIASARAAVEKAEQEAQQAAMEQQQAPAAAHTPETPAPNTQGTEEMVLVTRTGEKYHNRKCGNGTYTPATLEEALNRGLTPCSKCFG
ncbi:hypothetical protein [Candidatus Enterococcus mansonii]|uniref:Uncharacterized protein n=1 Tax=Candidatus Enterococcus mansonii TaxID=1834181 RepID=A0A242CDF6_9ENTE|nr:hypothetical protein [Enterococcus sp. 4G2_DIV0659]OTO07802.1 hypothetical protein A5880_002072 [Enterococcus sp. 4G2_DIV0659]